MTEDAHDLVAEVNGQRPYLIAGNEPDDEAIAIHECVVTSWARGLKGSRGYWECGRIGSARDHERTVRGIRDDAEDGAGSVPDIGRIQGRRSRRTEVGYESFRASGVRGLKSSRGGFEVFGITFTGNEGIADVPQRDRESDIFTGSTQEGGIDFSRPAGIKFGDEGIGLRLGYG